MCVCVCLCMCSCMCICMSMYMYMCMPCAGHASPGDSLEKFCGLAKILQIVPGCIPNSPNCPRVHSQFGQNPYCERGVPISSVAQSALQMLRSLRGLEHES